MSTGDTASWPGGANARNNAWFQFAWISNELATPKILVCPSDQGVGIPRAMANDFSDSVDGGFLSAAFKNGAVSYSIWLHSFFSSPRSILSGDRNIRYDVPFGGCASGLNLVQTIYRGSSSARWTNAIHGVSGNLLFTDGSVEQSSSPDLRRYVNLPGQDDNGSVHFISPF